MTSFRKRFISDTRVKRIRHRLEFWAMSAIARLLPRMRRSWVLWLAAIIGWLAYKVDLRGKKIAFENIEMAIRHGNLDLQGQSKTQLVQACYSNFSRNFLDLFWFSRLTPETFRQWVELDGEHVLEELCQHEGGGILLTPHFGSFEWASLVVGFMGLSLHIVARDFRNPLLNSVFTKARECSGHKVHHRDRVTLRLLRALHRGSNVAMLPDLPVPSHSAAAPVRMFGIPTFLSVIPAELSLRCSAPILAAICEPLPNGRVRLKILKVLQPMNRSTTELENRIALTQQVWDLFEEEIRRRPAYWLWMYRHWQFKDKASTGREPLKLNGNTHVEIQVTDPSHKQLQPAL
jgi:Kdo2-lipid IVA lauroyltransferase/acyltransferase